MKYCRNAFKVRFISFERVVPVLLEDLLYVTANCLCILLGCMTPHSFSAWAYLLEVDVGRHERIGHPYDVDGQHLYDLHYFRELPCKRHAFRDPRDHLVPLWREILPIESVGAFTKRCEQISHVIEPQQKTIIQYSVVMSTIQDVKAFLMLTVFCQR